jgi:hypothetical protein
MTDKMPPVDQRRRGMRQNLLRAVGQGLARSGYDAGAMVAPLVDACVPGQPMHDAVTKGRAESDAFYAPEGRLGEATSGVAQFVGDMAIGGAASKGLRAIRGLRQASRAKDLLRPPTSLPDPTRAASPLEYLRPIG